MKNILIFALALCIGLFSCSPIEESPEPKNTDTTQSGGGGGTGGGGGGGGGGTGPVQPNLTTASTIQFWGLVDGNLETYTAGGGSTMAATGKDSTLGADSTTASYASGLLNTLDLTGIFATVGTLKYPNSSTPSEANFLALFAPGNRTYTADIAEITLRTNELGVKVWSTTAGDQTGSTFEITQSASTGTPADPKVKAVIKFNCKVYNIANPTESKTITQGIIVAEFLGK
ncbi:MAG: hypothetical protein ACO1PI_14475 [Bacteroidota bacterium]